MTTCPCCGRIVRGSVEPGAYFFCSTCWHECEKCNPAVAWAFPPELTSSVQAFAQQRDELLRHMTVACERFADEFNRLIMPKLFDVAASLRQSRDDKADALAFSFTRHDLAVRHDPASVLPLEVE